IHGDTKEALIFAERLRKELSAKGIRIQPL
ncbi:MAG: lactam utilization protein LamB, partial [Clostridiales bacterium]